MLETSTPEITRTLTATYAQALACSSAVNTLTDGFYGGVTAVSGSNEHAFAYTTDVLPLGRLIVFGGRETVQIEPGTIGVNYSWSAKATCSPAGGSSVSYAYSDLVGMIGSPPAPDSAAAPNARSGLHTALTNWLTAGNVVERVSATRPLHRWIKLAELLASLDAGSWTITPTYADGQSPATPASSLSLSDGDFSFFGDY